MIVPMTPIAKPTEVNKITTTATSQAGTSSGGQEGGMARRDTFTYMGVTFILALSAIVKGSVPFRPRFEIIRWIAWFAVAIVVPGGGEAR